MLPKKRWIFVCTISLFIIGTLALLIRGGVIPIFSGNTEMVVPTKPVHSGDDSLSPSPSAAVTPAVEIIKPTADMFNLTGVEAAIIDAFVADNWPPYGEMENAFFVPALTIWDVHKTENGSAVYSVSITRYSYYDFNSEEAVATNAIANFQMDFEMQEKNDAFTCVSITDTSGADGKNTHSSSPLWNMEGNWNSLLKQYRDATGLNIKYVDGLTGQREPVD